MRLLLDSHTFIWLLEGDPKLSPAALDLLSDPDNERWVSAATIWEMAIKINLGKLTLNCPLSETKGFMAANGLSWLPVELTHSVLLVNLPLLHRDPFDRMLIAQALAEDLSVLSKDPWFPQYGVPVIW